MAALRVHQSQHRADGRRLAGTVRPQKAEDLPLLDREGYVLDPAPPPVVLGQVDGVDDDLSTAHCLPLLLKRFIAARSGTTTELCDKSGIVTCPF
jgi:hypothetical protein